MSVRGNMANKAFTPGATISVTGGSGASSAATALGKPLGGAQVRVASPAGGQQAHFKFGDSTVQAAATDTPVLPGSVELFTAPSSATHVAVFGVGGTPTLYFTSGYGD